MTLPPSPRPQNGLIRLAFLLLGFLLLAAGIVGLFLPLMPTTIFLILAAWCFSKSSRRLEAWLLGNKWLGPAVVNWRLYGVIPPRAKFLACTGMVMGLAIFWYVARPGPWLLIFVAIALAACAAYVLSRPSSPRSDADTSIAPK